MISSAANCRVFYSFAGKNTVQLHLWVVSAGIKGQQIKLDFFPLAHSSGLPVQIFAWEEDMGPIFWGERDFNLFAWGKQVGYFP